MRFDFAVFYVNVVTSTVVFSQLIIPDEILSSSVSELGTYAKRFDVDLRSRNDTDAVGFRLKIWQLGDNNLIRGCGFYVQANGDEDGFASLRFPASQEYKCGHDTYIMRTTSYLDGVTYDKQLRLPSKSERAEEVEVHADGYRRTYVDVVCVGLYNKWKSDYHSMCVNNELLRKCAGLTDKTLESYLPLDIWNDTITMSKSTKGKHKIVFRDLDFLVEGFQRLVRNASDIGATHDVCNRIDFFVGEKVIDDEYCEAEEVYNVNHHKSYFVGIPFKTFALKPARISPDLCVVKPWL